MANCVIVPCGAIFRALAKYKYCQFLFWIFCLDLCTAVLWFFYLGLSLSQKLPDLAKAVSLFKRNLKLIPDLFHSNHRNFIFKSKKKIFVKNIVCNVRFNIKFTGQKTSFWEVLDVLFSFISERDQWCKITWCGLICLLRTMNIQSKPNDKQKIKHVAQCL